MGKFLELCSLLLALGMVEVEAVDHINLKGSNTMKLFVFGDSYVDTGNTPKDFSNSWKQPYGMSYHGKPTGRFSDGRVLTDYIAQFLNITSPVPYEQRNSQVQLIHYGINFAYGGTGVFNTTVPLPNMSIQIDYFEKLLEKKVYTKSDLESSIVLISAAGNDYATYLRQNRNTKGIPKFTLSVINQITSNVQRVYELGVRKIAVGGIEPLGCLPRFIGPVFSHCDKSLDLAAKSHNLLLKQAVQKLGKDNTGSVFVILDLYRAFKSALDNTGDSLRPCCLGIGDGNNCSSVDEKGAKMYTVCNDLNSSFFWDMVHPSQHGWYTAYSGLQSSLHQLK